MAVLFCYADCFVHITCCGISLVHHASVLWYVVLRADVQACMTPPPSMSPCASRSQPMSRGCLPLCCLLDASWALHSPLGKCDGIPFWCSCLQRPRQTFVVQLLAAAPT